MRFKHRTVLLACGLGLASAQFLRTAMAAEPAPVILYSNDVLGEIEPCGCRSNPLGGMIRKEALLKFNDWLSAAGPKSTLQVDSGDLFFSSSEIPETLRPQARIQSMGLARALKATSMDLVVPGEKDFALGIEHYRKLIREAGIHPLAANLEARTGGTRSKSWKKAFPATAIRNVKRVGGGNLRVAFVGLLGQDLQLPDGLRATDPALALKALMPLLRRGTDRVIALTHQGFDADLKLAESIPGLDLIIGAHSQSFLQQPRQVGKTWIYQSSFRNQHAGLIRLAARSGEPESKLVELNAALDPPPTESTPIRKILEQTKAEIARANLDSEKAITAAAHQAAAEGTPKFQTFTKCAECHSRQFDFWRKTPHARAYETLVKAGAQNNKECLSCHSVGLADPEGYSDLGQIVQWAQPKPQQELASWLEDLRDARSAEKALEISRGVKKVHATVQCENCHFPPRDHPFGLESNPPKVAKTTCLNCHTPTRAPSWYNAEAGGNGKLDDEKLQKNLEKMSCPRDE